MKNLGFEVKMEKLDEASFEKFQQDFTPLLSPFTWKPCKYFSLGGLSAADGH
jgi:hypothetical protein